MKSFHVEIYIETSLKGPAIKAAAGEWLVEFVMENGDPVTRSGIVWKEKSTENALVLELLRDALAILTKSCSVRVNTRCGNVLNSINSHWVDKWKKDGWANAKRKPVGNAGLWQQVYALMEKHSVEVVLTPHSYQLVMQNDIREEMNRHCGK